MGVLALLVVVFSLQSHVLVIADRCIPAQYQFSNYFTLSNLKYDTTANRVLLEMKGKPNVYFGMGFGHREHSLSRSFTVLAEFSGGQVRANEWDLGSNHGMGDSLVPIGTTTYTSNVNGVVTVGWSAPLTPPSPTPAGTHFTFDPNSDTLTALWANGGGARNSNHANSGGVTIMVTSTDCTAAPQGFIDLSAEMEPGLGVTIFVASLFTFLLLLRLGRKFYKARKQREADALLIKTSSDMSSSSSSSSSGGGVGGGGGGGGGGGLQDFSCHHPHDNEYMPFINQNYVENEPVQQEADHAPPPHMMQPKLHMSYPYPPPAQPHPMHRQMMADLYRHPPMPHPQHQQPHPPPPHPPSSHMLDRDEAPRGSSSSMEHLGPKDKVLSEHHIAQRTLHTEPLIDPVPRLIHRNPDLGRFAKMQKRRAQKTSSAINPDDLPAPQGTVEEAEAKDKSTVVKVEPNGRLVSPPAASSVSNDLIPQIAILYVPNGTLPALNWYLGMLIEVRIQAKYLSLSNKEVVTRQIWGTDVYTEDSDAVAVLRHCGRVTLRPTPPTGYLGISAIFRVLPPRSQYLPSTRYGFRSRQWMSDSFRTSLEFVRSEAIHNANKFHVKTKAAEAATGRRKVRLVRPTAPIDRSHGPRGLVEQVKPVIPGVAVTFNVANDPILRYSLTAICDRGMDEKFWTSTRLKREVLYLESRDGCFELSRSASTGKYDTYRWAKVSMDSPLSHLSSLSRLKPTKSSAKRKKPEGVEGAVKLPLPLDRIIVLENDLDWDEIEWGPNEVRVRGHIYPIRSIQFKPASTD